MLNLLIVEDHPMMADAYKKALQPFSDIEPINFKIALNCKEAYEIIINCIHKFDIAIIDVILPSYNEKNLNSGAEIAILIRSTNPDCKIILLTSHSEVFILSNLVDKTDPEALLIKSDFSPEEFLMIFRSVLDGKQFYSNTAYLALQKAKKIKSDLDAVNRQIILLLAKGILTKNIPNFLNVSLSSVDKRKVQIKIFFDIEKGTDEDIIAKAKQFGFV